MSTTTTPEGAADRVATALAARLGRDLVAVVRQVTPADGDMGAVVQMRAIVSTESDETLYTRAWEGARDATTGNVFGDEPPWVIWVKGVVVIVDVKEERTDEADAR